MLRIAIQTKGRLNEESVNLLRESDINIDENKRKLLLPAKNFPIELLYLRDDDIPEAVATGVADLGIVGLNELEERGSKVDIVKRLGFGNCRISIAVPKAMEYSSPADLNGKRIATSYPAILKRFLESNGVEAKIVFMAGSVEMAPAAGMADVIFDIVSTGGTLISNGLKEVEKVFFSEAVLIGVPGLKENSEKASLLEEMLFRFEAVEESKDLKYLLMNLPEEATEEAIRILPSMRSPTIMPLAAKGWCSMHSVVKSGDMWEKIKQLKAIGAEGILVLSVDKIIK